MDSLAINCAGVVHANGFDTKEGRIILQSDASGVVKVTGEVVAKTQDRGGKIHVLGEYVQLVDEAKIDASGRNGGGEILIGGDFKRENPEISTALAVFVGKKVQVSADAHSEGDGGKVIFWGERFNQFFGLVSARGGKEGGNGGLVEISSHGVLIPSGLVDTKAEKGKFGTLLFDPVDVTIGVGNTNVTSPLVLGDLTPPTTSYVFNTGPGATIDAGDLITFLGSSNIIIDAVTPALGGSCIITVSSAVSWSAATFLRLIARNVALNASISNTNAGARFSPCIDIQANAASALAGTFDGLRMNNRSITTVSGDIYIIARGGNAGVQNMGIEQIGNSRIYLFRSSLCHHRRKRRSRRR